MLKRFFITWMLMIVAIGADANGMVVVPDSICVEDSVAKPEPKVEKEESFFDKVYEVIKNFSRVDKKYIETQQQKNNKRVFT